MREHREGECGSEDKKYATLEAWRDDRLKMAGNDKIKRRAIENLYAAFKAGQDHGREAAQEEIEKRRLNIKTYTVGD